VHGFNRIAFETEYPELADTWKLCSRLMECDISLLRCFFTKDRGALLNSDTQARVAAHRDTRALRNTLDDLYHRFDRFEFIHPDPLEFVHLYENKLDMEVAGFIASALAYGRVGQILLSVRAVLDRMGPSPCSFLLQRSPSEIRRSFQFFKHRFTTADDLSTLLVGLRKLVREYGSLEHCFMAGVDRANRNVLPALSEFVQKLEIAAGRKMPMLLPSPAGGSACKRLNLFLRWMIRRDKVDPGIWPGIPASFLVVPLDTHMHRIAGTMGLTVSKQANIRCAVEITEGFALICPEDPVRYDFALTRLGMSNNPLPRECCSTSFS
jgi:uncharacterized protein (TIGR02757 family)